MGCIGQAADSFAPFGGSRRSVVFVCRAPCRCRAPCLPLSLFQGNPFTISPQYLPQAQDSYQNAHFCSFSSPFFSACALLSTPQLLLKFGALELITSTHFGRSTTTHLSTQYKTPLRLATYSLQTAFARSGS